MNIDMAALHAIEADKGIPVEVVVETIKTALLTAYRHTEGHEAEVLKGAAATIGRCRPVIVMAAYHKPGDTQALPALVKSICPDYVCTLHRDVHETFVAEPAPKRSTHVNGDLSLWNSM